jgi:hypothetical protein
MEIRFMLEAEPIFETDVANAAIKALRTNILSVIESHNQSVDWLFSPVVTCYWKMYPALEKPLWLKRSLAQLAWSSSD